MFVFDQYRDNDKHKMWGVRLINVWEGRGSIIRNMYKWSRVYGLAVFIIPSLHIIIYRYVLNNSACWARFFLQRHSLLAFSPLSDWSSLIFILQRACILVMAMLRQEKPCLLALAKTFPFIWMLHCALLKTKWSLLR